MVHDDTVAEDTQSRGGALPRRSPADLPVRCGAMVRQRDGHGWPSSPQQFIRLVGGHRRPVPVADTPAAGDLTG